MSDDLRNRVARAIWDTLGSDYTFDEAMSGEEKATHAQAIKWVFDVADAAIAEMGGLRVRELTWEYHPAGKIAAPPTGHAYIIDTRMKGRVHSIKGFNPQREFASLDEAKAAVNADHRDRILAAIEPAPAKGKRPPISADWMDGPGTGPAPVSAREADIDAAASKALFGYMDRSDRYSCGVQAGVSRMCAALRAIAEGKDDE